jgi:hypothetical protein
MIHQDIRIAGQLATEAYRQFAECNAHGLRPG